MLQVRAIPCLLIHNAGLMKTVKFRKPRYVGDPINVVRIFNEKEVDELIVLDIDATRHQREPRYAQIEDIVSEAFMPVCYGGGIKTIDQMRRLFSLGIEKISVSSAAIENTALVRDAARVFGSQSIVVTLDVKRASFRTRKYVFTHNATKNTRRDPLVMAREMEKVGAGELVINDVDRDGTMRGYDIELFRNITSSVNLPIIALGGAGSLMDLQAVVKEANVPAVAAGSLFVFTGVHRAVLVSYPSQNKLRRLFQESVI